MRGSPRLLGTALVAAAIFSVVTPVSAQPAGDDDGRPAAGQVPSTIVQPDGPRFGVPDDTDAPLVDAATPTSHSGIDPEFAEAPPFIGHHSFGQTFIGEPVLHEDSGRVFLPTRDGLAVLDLDAQLLSHEPISVGGFVIDVVIDTNVFVLAQEGVVELDITTLAEVNRYPKSTPMAYNRLAVVGDTIVVGASNQGLVFIDRDTGVETEVNSLGFGANTTHLQHHSSWGSLIVVPFNEELAVFDVAGNSPTEVTRLTDRRAVLVSPDGQLLVQQGQNPEYELRSVPSFAIRSTTTIPDEILFVQTVGVGAGIFAAAEHGDLIWLLDLDGTPILRLPHPAQRSHLLVPTERDRVIAVDYIRNVVWAIATGPAVQDVDQAVFRPDWFDTMTIDGWGLEAVTDVLVNGQSVGFSELAAGPSHRTTRLRLDVTDVPSAAVAEITAISPFGESSIQLDRDPPLGWAPVSIRSRVDGAADRNENFRIECTNIRIDRVVPAGQTLTVLVPTLANCFVEASNGRAQMRSGFVDPVRPGPLADVWDGRLLFRSGAPAHLAFVRTVPTTDSVFWLFNFPVGNAPDGVRYPFDIICGDWSQRVVLDPGFGARVAIPDSADNRCLAELANDRGADQVVSRQIDRFQVRRTAAEAMWFAKPKIGNRYMTFVIDHGGADIENPVFVGVPMEDVGAKRDAGVVHVFPTGTDGRPRGVGSQMLRQGRGGIPGPAEAGDRFGEIIEVADFDADGWLDVAIGVPNEDLGATKNAGLVHVVYGRENGYRGGRVQTFHQSVIGVPGSPGRGDRFGSALAALDWNGDGNLDLAIGVPGERVAGEPRAGVVQILMGGPTGLSATTVVELSQQSDEYDTSPERGDQFGSALAGSGSVLAIGVPREDIASIVDGGMIHVVDGLTGEQISDWQGAFTDDRAEERDRFGEVLELVGGRLVVGVPREDVGSRRNGGKIHVYGFEQTYLDQGPLTWATVDSYDRSDIDGASVGRGDEFGAAVLLVNVTSAPDVLFIGSPGDAVNGRDGAGTVIVMELTTRTRRQFLSEWNHATPRVPGTPQENGRLGTSLLAGPWGSFLIGAPGVSVAGDAEAGELLSTQTFEDWASIDQDSRRVGTPAERRDRFGTTVG